MKRTGLRAVPWDRPSLRQLWSLGSQDFFLALMGPLVAVSQRRFRAFDQGAVEGKVVLLSSPFQSSVAHGFCSEPSGVLPALRQIA